MSKTPKEIARETANLIVTDLLDTPREKALTKDEVIALIKNYIEGAYTKLRSEGVAVSPVEINKLFKALSVFLHPDKIDSRLSSYLVQNDLEGAEPFKILKQIHQKQLIAVNNPKGELNRFIEYVDQLMKSMEESLDRYHQPFRFLAKAAYWTLFIFVGIAVGVGGIGIVLSSIVLGIGKGLINFTLNSLTSNQYTKEVNDYLEPDFEKHKAEFLKNLRDKVVDNLKTQQKDSEAERILEMSDDDLFAQLIKEEVDIKIQSLFQLQMNPFVSNQETVLEQLRAQFSESLTAEINDKYKEQIKSNVSLNPFTRLKLISLALYHAITKPLDEVQGSKLLSVLLRPLQIVASPFILGAAALVELADLTVAGIALTGAALCLAAQCATLAALNTPLYALDLCRYTARKVQDCLCSNEKSDELVNGGPKGLLMLEWHQNQSSVPTEKPPVHSGPLFTIPKSKSSTIIKEPELQPGFSPS